MNKRINSKDEPVCSPYTLKYLYWIAAVLLLVAMAKLPAGYYVFLRIAITAICVFGAVREYSGSIDVWLIAFALIAILFNPVIPLYLRDKTAWMVLDAVCGIMFVVKGLKVKNKTK